MKAVVVNFRRGPHRQTTNQMILLVDGVDNREKAAKLIGKEVSWKSPAGKILTGKICSAHGNSGAVRAHFDTGMPGQAVGTPIEIK